MRNEPTLKGVTYGKGPETASDRFRDEPSGPVFSRILVALDGCRQSEEAVEIACRLASEVGAALTLAHVVLPPINYSAAEFVLPDRDLYHNRVALGQELLAKAKDRAKALAPSAAVDLLLWEGDPATEIVKAARQCHADLIVMGTHARGHIARAILGSVADAVTRHAGCPVLTVPNMAIAANAAATRRG